MNKTQRTAVAIAGAGAVVTLCLTPIHTQVRLLFNPTTSAPEGWYVIEREHTFRVGDYVVANLPNDAARLADDRRYLPSSVPILKRIGALASQVVCLSGEEVLIDGRVVARALARDAAGRDLTAWGHCRALQGDELFLLSSTNPASFDSRYFGPITRINVIGKATPIWTW
jgi:conjugative transfer signal peptidase TraF